MVSGGQLRFFRSQGFGGNRNIPLSLYGGAMAQDFFEPSVC